MKQRFIDEVVALKRSEETKKDIIATLDRFEAIISPRHMGDCTTAAIDRFKAARSRQDSRKTSEKLSHQTINRDCRNLKAFFRKVARWKVLAEVPDVEMLDTTENEKPPHSEADLRAMLSHCGAATMPNHLTADHREQWWRTLVVLLWETGARIGERMSLQWQQVDLDGYCLTFNAGNTKGKRRKIVFLGDEGCGTSSGLRSSATRATSSSGDTRRRTAPGSSRGSRRWPV
ncbi:MAG: tyrosine-type recombinase/integrase [Pirellulaceae bacterium]